MRSKCVEEENLDHHTRSEFQEKRKGETVRMGRNGNAKQSKRHRSLLDIVWF